MNIKLNYVIDNDFNFDYDSSRANDHAKYIEQVFSFDRSKVNKVLVTYYTSLTFL